MKTAYQRKNAHQRHLLELARSANDALSIPAPPLPSEKEGLFETLRGTLRWCSLADAKASWVRVI